MASTSSCKCTDAEDHPTKQISTVQMLIPSTANLYSLFLWIFHHLSMYLAALITSAWFLSILYTFPKHLAQKTGHMISLWFIVYDMDHAIKYHKIIKRRSTHATSVFLGSTAELCSKSFQLGLTKPGSEDLQICSHWAGSGLFKPSLTTLKDVQCPARILWNKMKRDLQQFTPVP